MRLLASLILVFCAAAAAAAPRSVRTSQLTPRTYPAATECVTGNRVAAVTYSGWWSGNESYARLVEAGQTVCGCDVGISVKSVHMTLGLRSGTDLWLQARLALVDPNGGCPRPGQVLAWSTPLHLTGIAVFDYYDVAIPCDFVCAETGQDYFVIVDFISGVAPQLELVGGGDALACSTWNDWGDGWVDLVGEMGFPTDLTFWADMNCCYQTIPAHRERWGGIKALYR